MPLDRITTVGERESRPGDEPQGKVWADDPSSGLVDMWEQGVERRSSEEVERLANGPLGLGLAFGVEDSRVWLDCLADRNNGIVDRTGLTHVNDPDFPYACGRNDPSYVVRELRFCYRRI